MDVSWHADHLFIGRNKGIVSWCYARDPWGAAWVVLEDGRLLSVTRGGDGNWAWAKHETDNQSTAVGDGGDRVLSVCSVPGAHVSTSIRADDVYLAIERGGTTFIERLIPSTNDTVPRYGWDEEFDGNIIGSQQVTYPLDSWVPRLVTKATGNTAATVFALSLNHLEGREVWVSCPGIDPSGPYTVVGGDITVPAGWGPQLDEDGWIALGSPLGTFEAWVNAGSPGDPYSTFIVGVGLPYTCDLGLLDAAPGTLNQKSVVKVGFEVDNAVGLLIGEDFDHLVEWQQRQVVDAYGYPSAASTLAWANVLGSWNLQGRAVLRQEKPLPVTVLGITRELAPGGK